MENYSDRMWLFYFCLLSLVRIECNLSAWIRSAWMPIMIASQSFGKMCSFAKNHQITPNAAIRTSQFPTRTQTSHIPHSQDTFLSFLHLKCVAPFVAQRAPNMWITKVFHLLKVIFVSNSVDYFVIISFFCCRSNSECVTNWRQSHVKYEMVVFFSLFLFPFQIKDASAANQSHRLRDRMRWHEAQIWCHLLHGNVYSVHLNTFYYGNRNWLRDLLLRHIAP